MMRIPSDFVLPAVRVCLRHPLWLLAPLAAAAASPAAAQSPCPATPNSWQSHSTVYSFAYYSGWRANGAGFVHCVRNTGSLGMFVDWRGSGLISFVPPKKIFYSTGPATSLGSKKQLFFYGARPHVITVPTARPLAMLGPAGASWAARSGAGPFLRAFVLKPGARPVASGDTSALLYLPTNVSLLAGLADKKLSLRALIKRLEAAPDELGAFGMTFANRVTAAPDGRLAVSWECRYTLPKLERSGSPPFYLRFSDSDLHRRMVGRSDPLPVIGWGGEAEFKAALPPLDPARLAARQAKLQVLLADRRTVIASIPISYSGPRS